MCINCIYFNSYYDRGRYGYCCDKFEKVIIKVEKTCEEYKENNVE